MEFAKKLGLPVTTVANYENGAEPRLDTLIEMADLFGVSIDELVRPEIKNYINNPSTKIIFINGKGGRKVIEVGEEDKNEMRQVAWYFATKKFFEEAGIE